MGSRLALERRLCPVLAPDHACLGLAGALPCETLAAAALAASQRDRKAAKVAALLVPAARRVGSCAVGLLHHVVLAPPHEVADADALVVQIPALVLTVRERRQGKHVREKQERCKKAHTVRARLVGSHSMTPEIDGRRPPPWTFDRLLIRAGCFKSGPPAPAGGDVTNAGFGCETDPSERRDAVVSSRVGP